MASNLDAAVSSEPDTLALLEQLADQGTQTPTRACSFSSEGTSATFHGSTIEREDAEQASKQLGDDEQNSPRGPNPASPDEPSAAAGTGKTLGKRNEAYTRDSAKAQDQRSEDTRGASHRV